MRQGRSCSKGVAAGGVCHLIFVRRSHKLGALVPWEAQLNKRAVLVLGPVLAASFFCESALSKPNHTTKYTYYTVSGNTPGAIYSALVKRGPRVGGVKAYAADPADAARLWAWSAA